MVLVDVKHHDYLLATLGVWPRRGSVREVSGVWSVYGVHRPHFLRERRGEEEPNRGPSAYQPDALLLGQIGSLEKDATILPLRYELNRFRSSVSIQIM